MDNLQAFFDQMKIEMAKQTKDIMTQLDEKLIPFTQDIEKLKLENKHLKEKLAHLEKSNRANNIIIYKLKETEQSSTDLMELTIKKLKTDLNIPLESSDINAIRRIGKKDGKDGKIRPILVAFLSNWKKNEILKYKKKLKEIYISEDYPKDILDKRRELQATLIEERNKGNYAVIRYDRLIVKEGFPGKDKRKRTSPSSPDVTAEQPRKQHLPSTSKSNRINAFDAMRGRSNSLSKCTPSSEHKL